MRKSFIQYALVSFCTLLVLIAASGAAAHAKSKTTVRKSVHHTAHSHHTVSHHSKTHKKHSSSSKKKHRAASHAHRRGVYMARTHHAGRCQVTAESRKHWTQRATYYARKHGVSPTLFVAQIRQESGFRPCAIGPSGAVGIAQIHPLTARTWKVNPHNPEASLNASAQRMAASIRRNKHKGMSQKRAERRALHQYGTI